MASNLLSRFLPPGTGSPSVYEALRQQDESSETSDVDVEERAGIALDEENLGHRFEDLELDQAQVDELDRSPPITGQSDGLLEDNVKPQSRGGWNQRTDAGEAQSRRGWMNLSPGPEEGDDEVPQSLLIEGGEGAPTAMAGGDHNQGRTEMPSLPGPSTAEARVRWDVAQKRRRLQRDSPQGTGPQRATSQAKKNPLLIEPRERAMWRWANVENLDNFLKDVYDYFLGNGIWCIMLSRALNLLCVDVRLYTRLKIMLTDVQDSCLRRRIQHVPNNVHRLQEGASEQDHVSNTTASLHKEVSPCFSGTVRRCASNPSQDVCFSKLSVMALHTALDRKGLSVSSRCTAAAAYA